MLHNENIRKADETYEIRHDDKGNAIHLFITDGEAIAFPTMNDLVKRVYFGENEIERFYISEQQLDDLYAFEVYDYYSLKAIAKKITDGEIPPPPKETHLGI